MASTPDQHSDASIIPGSVAMKSNCYLLLAFGALPMLIYPFVLFANLMTFAGHRTGNESPVLIAAVYAFLIGTTAYPLVYLVCAGIAINCMMDNKERAAILYSAAPPLYLAALIVGFMFAG